MLKFLTTAHVRDYHELEFLSPIDIMSEDKAAGYRLRPLILHAVENLENFSAILYSGADQTRNY